MGKFCPSSGGGMGTSHHVWLLALLTLNLLVVGLGPPRARAEVHVGNGSCVTGFDVCLRNTGDIGDTSCNEIRACFGTTAAIRSGQCNAAPNPVTGKGVCEPYRGQAGQGQEHGQRSDA